MHLPRVPCRLTPYAEDWRGAADANLSSTGHHHPTIEVRGEIDLAGADILVQRVIALADPVGASVALDLTGVDFINCAGLHALTEIDEHVRAHGGTLYIVAASGPVNRLLMLLGTHTVQPENAVQPGYEISELTSAPACAPRQHRRPGRFLPRRLVRDPPNRRPATRPCSST